MLSIVSNNKNDSAIVIWYILCYVVRIAITVARNIIDLDSSHFKIEEIIAGRTFIPNNDGLQILVVSEFHIS